MATKPGDDLPDVEPLEDAGGTGVVRLLGEKKPRAVAADEAAGPAGSSTNAVEGEDGNTGAGSGARQAAEGVAPFGAGLVGITSEEAQHRLKQYGYNELQKEKPRSIFRIILGVLKEPMFMLLLGAAVLYFLLGSPDEAALLLGFVVFIICLTIYEERKTEHALAALKKLSSPRALVIRDGERFRIPGREVVPGDLVIIAEGDRVPADGIEMDGLNVSVDESILTGESLSVRKMPPLNGFDEALSMNMVRPDKCGSDMPYLFSGTLMVQGRCLFIVKATGTETELGKIGKGLASVQTEKTPLEKENRSLVLKMLVIGMCLCVAVVLLGGFLSSEKDLATRWKQALLNGVALAMALLPEEFGVVLTVFMALGAWRISQKKVLCRRNAAIEALGCASVLCTDKTGTLTLNRMVVHELCIPDGTACKVVQTEFPAEPFHVLLEHAILSSQRDPFDPMEIALHALGQRDVCFSDHLHASWTVMREYPLSRQMLAISRVWRASKEGVGCEVSCKGAPEAIADLCHMSPEGVARVTAQVTRLAEDGLRVLGVCHAPFTLPADNCLPANQHDFDFVFLGLIGFKDPIRPDVPRAVAECYSAGMRVVMITGDHPGTALHIASEAGIQGNEVITGPELSDLQPEALAKRVATCNIFARVVPEQKLKLVQAFKDAGCVTAMTGDGVNDAPALKAAHIGIAMGERGTDVAREASHLVLLDDSFPSIVAACRLGRRIFDNLCKAMVYIIAVHVPFAGMSLVPVALNWPVLLGPVHIVFAELVIDPACSVVFEMEPEEPTVMHRKPRSTTASMVSLRNFLIALTTGLVILSCALLLFWVNHTFLEGPKTGLEDGHFVAMSFGTLMVGNLGVIFVFRSFSESAWTTLRRPNKAAWIIIPSAFVALLLTIYVPFVNDLFAFKPLPVQYTLEFVAAGLIGPGLFELYKLVWRISHQKERADLAAKMLRDQSASSHGVAVSAAVESVAAKPSPVAGTASV